MRPSTTITCRSGAYPDLQAVVVPNDGQRSLHLAADVASALGSPLVDLKDLGGRLGSELEVARATAVKNIEVPSGDCVDIFYLPKVRGHDDVLPEHELDRHPFVGRKDTTLR